MTTTSPPPEDRISQDRLDQFAEILSVRFFAVDQSAAEVLLSDSFHSALARSMRFRTEVLGNSLEWEKPQVWSEGAEEESSRAWARKVRAALGERVREGKLWKAKLPLLTPRSPEQHPATQGPLFFWVCGGINSPFLAPFWSWAHEEEFRFANMRYGGAGICQLHPVSRVLRDLRDELSGALGPGFYLSEGDSMNPSLPNSFWEEAEHLVAERSSNDMAIKFVTLYGNEANPRLTEMNPCESHWWSTTPGFHPRELASELKSNDTRSKDEKPPVTLSGFQKAMSEALRVGSYIRSLPYHEPRLDFMRFFRNDNFLLTKKEHEPLGFFVHSNMSACAVFSGNGCDAAQLKMIHRRFLLDYKDRPLCLSPLQPNRPPEPAPLYGYAVF